MNQNKGLLNISSVALGTWTFAGDGIWGASDETQCRRVIHAALDQGINFFDTAPNYGDGRSESILGNALKGRSDVTIASKFKIDGMTPKRLQAQLSESLGRLRRERVDLLQIHWPGTTTCETLEALDTLMELVRAGDVGGIGVCNFGSYDLAETMEYPIMSNQLPYSLLWRTIENGIVEAGRRRSLKIIAYSALHQGLLSGNYNELDDYPEGRKRTRHFSSNRPGTRHSEDGMEPLTDHTLKRLLVLSRELGLSLPELALGFVRSRPFIDVILIGARTEEQLLSSCRAAETVLDLEVIKLLEYATNNLLAATGGNPDMYQSESRVRYL